MPEEKILGHFYCGFSIYIHDYENYLAKVEEGSVYYWEQEIEAWDNGRN